MTSPSTSAIHQVRSLRQQTSELALRVPELLAIAGDLFRVEQLLAQPKPILKATSTTVSTPIVTAPMDAASKKLAQISAPEALAVATPSGVVVSGAPPPAPLTIVDSIGKAKKVSKPPPPGWPKPCQYCSKKSIKTPRGLTLHLKTCKGAPQNATASIKTAAIGRTEPDRNQTDRTKEVREDAKISLKSPSQNGAVAVDGLIAHGGNAGGGQKRKLSDFSFEQAAPDNAYGVDICEDDDDFYEQEEDDEDNGEDLDGFVVPDDEELSGDDQYDHDQSIHERADASRRSGVHVKKRRLTKRSNAIESSGESVE